MLCLGLSVVLPGGACASGTVCMPEDTLAKERTYKLVRSTINKDVNERIVSGKVTEGAGKDGFVGVNMLSIAGAINRGWLAGNAADYYNKGIAESIKFYNIVQSEIDKFLTAKLYPGNTEKGLQKIVEQKYIAFFENSGRQANSREGFYFF